MLPHIQMFFDWMDHSVVCVHAFLHVLFQLLFSVRGHGQQLCVFFVFCFHGLGCLRLTDVFKVPVPQNRERVLFLFF